MARIRTIKPEFFTSESVLSVSPLARIFFIGLWCESDREGRLKWKPKTLKVRYLPIDNVDIDELCEELESNDLIATYSVDGVDYCEIPGFKTHQVINNRESNSILPPRDSDASPRVKAEGRKEGRERKERKGTSIAVQHEQVHASPTLYFMPLNDGTDFEITQQQFDKWGQLYLSVNIDTEIRKMIGWLDANKSKRKTRSGFLRFANSWLAKVQDNGGSSGGSGIQSSVDWHKDLGI